MDTTHTFINSYSFLNQCLRDWYERVTNRGGLVIAISRKAPRLWEYCERNLSDNVTEEKKQGITVVSEIALPFIDFSLYKNVSIVDDAIYHGTTFDKIVEIVIAARGRNTDNLYLSPVVMTSESRNMKYASMLDPESVELPREYIPFYVDTIIQRFDGMAKSYDMEFPIFTYELSDEKSSVLRERLKVLAKDLCDDENSCYGTKQWIREEEREIENYTIVLDSIYSKRSYQPDFAKLRFFANGNKLCVTSYCVMPVLESSLCKNTDMLSGDALDVWNLIIEKINETEETSNNDSEVIYQAEKTKVIVLNYLYSYGQFMAIRKDLEGIVGAESKVKVESRDFDYIFGIDLIGVKDMIQSTSFNPFEHSTETHVSSSVSSKFPIPYIYGFALQMKNDLSKFHKTDERLSCEFGAMHRWIELPSRELPRSKDYGRLRFGESFRSLIDRYSTIPSNAEIRKQLHQGLDLRIDRGSIVPNYVKIDNEEGGTWFRLFRSGENEDPCLDQPMRFFVGVIAKYLKIVERTEIWKEEIDFLLGILGHYSDLNSKTTIGYINADNILESAVAHDILSKVDEKEMKYVIKRTPLTLQLLSGTIYDNLTRDVIDNCCSFAGDLSKNRFSKNHVDLLAESLLWVNFDENKNAEILSQWATMFINKFIDKPFKGSDFYVFVTEYIIKYIQCVPSMTAFDELTQQYEKMAADDRYADIVKKLLNTIENKVLVIKPWAILNEMIPDLLYLWMISMHMVSPDDASMEERRNLEVSLAQLPAWIDREPIAKLLSLSSAKDVLGEPQPMINELYRRLMTSFVKR